MPQIRVVPHIVFNVICAKNGWGGDAIPTDVAFISIIDSPAALRFWNDDNSVFASHHLNNAENVLNLDFDDVSNDGDHCRALTDEQAEEIIAFILKHRGKDFLVHCKAGFSRSAAIGQVIKDFFPEYENNENYDGRNAFVFSKLKNKMYEQFH